VDNLTHADNFNEHPYLRTPEIGSIKMHFYSILNVLKRHEWSRKSDRKKMRRTTPHDTTACVLSFIDGSVSIEPKRVSTSFSVKACGSLVNNNVWIGLAVSFTECNLALVTHSLFFALRKLYKNIFLCVFVI